VRLLFVVLALMGVTVDARQVDCGDAQQCRRLALEAAERQDYEAFHTLAWRAVQTGPSGDPQLMSLLARAQSLSGRPHDALVMIRRLAEKGVAIEAATHDDFRRVRALPGWPAIENLLAPAPPAPAPPAAPASIPAPSAALRIAPTVGFTPGGMAYDSASARFVIGDRRGRKLVVVSEQSTAPQDLVRAESAGFANVRAVEIDHRRGDLWVVSASDTETPDGTSALHKLQLISGRPLDTYRLAGAVFADVALMPDGTPLALDSAGRRVFRLRSGAQGIEAVGTLDVPAPASLASAGDGTIYIAHGDGLARLDPTTRKLARLKPCATSPSGGAGLQSCDLTGLTWIRRHRDDLIALQATGSGCRLVRLRIDSMRSRVRAVEPMADSVGAGCPPAAVSGDSVFYVQEDAGEMVIRRVPLK